MLVLAVFLFARSRVEALQCGAGAPFVMRLLESVATGGEVRFLLAIRASAGTGLLPDVTGIDPSCSCLELEIEEGEESGRARELRVRGVLRVDKLDPSMVPGLFVHYGSGGVAFLPLPQLTDGSG